MEPVSTTLLGAAKLLGDLAKSLKGTDKDKIELLAMQVNWAKDVVTTITAELDKLKEENAELGKELRELREWKAFHDISEEYETRSNGLLYKKGTNEGPFCPKDKIMMIQSMSRVRKCPICGITSAH